MVDKAWRHEIQLEEAISKFENEASDWNKLYFRNVFCEKEEFDGKVERDSKKFGQLSFNLPY